jgi:hypothetical protein
MGPVCRVKRFAPRGWPQKILRLKLTNKLGLSWSSALLKFALIREIRVKALRTFASLRLGVNNSRADGPGCMLQRSMKEKGSIQPGQEPAGIRQRLTELREAMLPLHKALLEFERIGYEATFGKIQSPYQFLKLVTDDPWFAWLTPMTQLITAMDEMLDAKKEPLTVAGVDAVAERIKTLLVATEGGGGFPRHYDEALQRNPDVVLAHAAVAQLIRAQPRQRPKAKR